MKRKMLLLVSLMGLVLCAMTGEATADLTADQWDSVVVPRTAGANIPAVWIKYDNMVIYSDRNLRSDKDEYLDVDLFLRCMRDVTMPETWAIYGDVLTIKGTVPLVDLSNIYISSLAEYNGKLYIGTYAFDSAGDGGGTCDDYRRDVYVTESVADGCFTSTVIHDQQLHQLNRLTIDAILPGKIRDAGQRAEDESPTFIGVQIRTAETETGLERAAFAGPLPSKVHYTDCTEPLVIPAGHEYLQYRVVMKTADGRLTPVLRGLTFECGGSGAPRIFHSFDDQAVVADASGVRFDLEPGAVVLDNKRTTAGNGRDAGQVSIVHAFKALINPLGNLPPDWLSDVAQYIDGRPGRNFSASNYPYPGVVAMAEFGNRLVMNIGVISSAVQTCTGGEFGDYHHSGYLRSAWHWDWAYQYSETAFDWWGEGNGTFRVLNPNSSNPLLVNNCVDTKSFAGPEVPPGCQIYRFYDSDQWHVGITPSQFGGHLWDIQSYSGQLVISRNKGVYKRDMPASVWPYNGHNDAASYNPASWTRLEGTEHLYPKPDYPSDQYDGFVKPFMRRYDGYLVVSLTRTIWGKDSEDHEVFHKILVYNDTLGEPVAETDLPIINDCAPVSDLLQINLRLMLWGIRGSDEGGGSPGSGDQNTIGGGSAIPPISRFYYTPQHQ